MALPEVLPRLDVMYSGHANDSESSYIDIVVVHGIFTDDFDEAWKTTNALNETISWLTDANMLPAIIPHIRVLNFRYDPQPGRDGIRLHLERTSSMLKNKIQEHILHIKHRPVIFVAHGYGGLIALKALVAENLGSRTIGLVSFATPFRTEDSSPALPSFPWSSRSTNSPEVLRELLQEYRRSPSSRHIQIRCFYETQPSKVPGGIIVPRAAAILGDPNSLAFALDADHMHINKYSGLSDHNFELVSDVLQGLSERAFPYVLAQAIFNGDITYARSIISHHCREIATDERMDVVLATVISTDSFKLLELLLTYHVNINVALNGMKDTALILAARIGGQNCAEIVRLLLEKGAEVGSRNIHGHTALDLAELANLTDVAALLKDRPPLVGPLLKRSTFNGDRLILPRQVIDDLDSASAFHARIADVYEVSGRERTFLRSPSVHDLVYEHGPRHLMNRATSRETETGPRKFRWLHLPANNLLWMKDLIQRTYYERDHENSSDEEYYLRKCSDVLDRALWESQVIVSPIDDLSYIRHLAPRCRLLPSLRKTPDFEFWPQSTEIVFSMPFLHYEESQKRQTMATTINSAHRASRRHPHQPSKNSPDENLIWAYLGGEVPLHCRRTLDQYYYESLDSDTPPRPDLTPRNLDQVISRFMAKQWKDDDPYVLMVDQIWIVLLEDDTLITSFPQRWGHTNLNEGNATKLADIAGILSKELSNENRAPLTSPYDMLLLIIETVTTALFDVARHHNPKLRFIEFFERKIQEVTNAEAVHFAHLKQSLELLSVRNQDRDQADTLTKLLDELLDISNEVELINEIKDIKDELLMLEHIFDSQAAVLDQMRPLFTYRDPQSQKTLSPQIVNKFTKILENVEQRRLKMETMFANSHRTYKSLNDLFDLKQKQANVLEAHYARKVAQDSGRQSTTLFIFTVVTIIFLPLSFMSSFYALSIKEFPRDPSNQNQLYMSLDYVSSRIFGIGFSVAILIVGLGFFVNFLIIKFPMRRARKSIKSRTRRDDESSQQVEHKVFFAEKTPIRETASAISYMSYSPRKGASKSSFGSQINSILHFPRQNTGEKAKRSATV